MCQNERMNETKPVSVSLLALPDGTPAALYGLYEVLSSAGIVWPMLTGATAGAARFEVRIVGLSAETFGCAAGVPVSPHAGIAEIGRSDIVIVPDVAIAADQDPRGMWQSAIRWLRNQHEGGALICTVCTGSLLLAEAGLLNGIKATTHWSAADMIARYYPAVRLQPERVLALDGEAHGIITSGGAASWEDLALYLIARFCGQEEAVRIAKVFVLGDRSEGQLPYAGSGMPRQHDDAVVGAIQQWIADHYIERAPVARMAERSGLPERTFKRRFKIATGRTPGDYVQTLRIEEAKQLLETTGDPIESIGFQVGYEDPAYFRRLFKRWAGITPSRYRQRFQAVGKVRED